MNVAVIDEPVRTRPRRGTVVRTLAVGLPAVLILLAAVAPTLLTSRSPLESNPRAVLLPPSWEHPFGTDQIGRDQLARVVHGAQYSLSIGVGAILLAAIVGVLIGTLSGLAPRVVDEAVTRFLDVVNAFPEVLLALVVIAVVGPGPVNVLVAIGVASIPRFARVVRAQVFVLRHSGWVEVATTQGLSYPRRVFKHIVPNVLGPVVVLGTIGTGTAMIAAAGLSFLRLGPQPPIPEWGAMLSESRDYVQLGWWLAVFPGLAILTTVAVVTLIGRRAQRRFEGRLP
ncbi:ABC transporter permease [Rhodococcoides kyotonense]|uniref:Peptide/nickel transport system permease protein n=1 Tax=Rhodococcoides kyotonense TaxID=398843 RepID=A0A239GEF1_9NOCA|nr:ABC transporter permease [Rhodococcus kyotonensis]SNS67686.1 peptide/nickel transport system permease protein [Rhodococcus kyotonensis]